MAAATETQFQTADEAIALQSSILEGPRHIHPFEGRVWTAQDVRDEQQALHDHMGQVGRALGSGVIDGLWVTLQSGTQPGSEAIVQVTEGRAINGKGQPLELGNTKRIALTRVVTNEVTEAGLFAPCGATTGGQSLTQGTWLLVLSPASGFEERAPKTPPTGNGVAAGCGFRYRREGVQLRLVQLPLSLTEPGTDDLSAVSRFRNQVAHKCFGTAETHAFLLDPFAVAPPDVDLGALSAPRSSGALTECDVPLALVAFGQSRVLFIDNWCVRRRPAPVPQAVQSTAGAMGWPALVEDYRRAIAQAVMMQFREQFRWLQLELGGQLEGIAATNYFSFLPPAGAVPTAIEGQARVSAEFFDGIAADPSGPIPVSPSVIRAALTESLDHEPVAISSGGPSSFVIIRPATTSQTNYVVFLRREIVDWKSSFDGVLAADLTRVTALSWDHGQISDLTLQLGTGRQMQFGVAFAVGGLGSTSRMLDFASVNQHTFQLFFETEDLSSGVLTTHRVQPSQIQPVQPTQLSADGRRILSMKLGSVTSATAAALLISPAVHARILEEARRVWVVIQGDLVLDKDGRAIDANHLRGELPTGSGLPTARFGIQGGAFLSWFTVPSQTPMVDINSATRDDLLAIPGIDVITAENLLNARTIREGFTSIDDLTDVVPLEVLNGIRGSIIVGGPPGGGPNL